MGKLSFNIDVCLRPFFFFFVFFVFLLLFLLATATPGMVSGGSVGSGSYCISFPVAC